jgi:hypothetical protein
MKNFIVLLPILLGSILFFAPSASARTNVVTQPESQKWYFAEGRIGGGFVEWITIGNPNAVDCTVNIEHFFTNDRGGSGTKTITLDVPELSRGTEYVNNDLGITQFNMNGAVLSTEVTVSNTPTCPGVVAERPMYFNNYEGVSSGTDSIGSTKTAKTWYFAEMPVGSSGKSFLSIFNPHTEDAHVTINYFSGGVIPSSTGITVHADSTLRFDAFPADQHDLAVQVTSSDTEIVVEKPSYYSGISGFSGAANILGTLDPAYAWILPSGSTDTTNREDLFIANIGSLGPATVAVELLPPTGAALVHNLAPVAQGSQAPLFSINSLITPQLTSKVSVVVISSVPIFVQRVDYDYTGSNKNTPDWNEQGVSASAGIPSGAIGNDNGQPPIPISNTPDSINSFPSSYSFAEGFVSANFNEFIDLANPTNTSENISLEFTNMLNQQVTDNVVVNSQSRLKVDVTQFIEDNSGSNFTLSNVKAYAISAIVNCSSECSFGAEREMHWNAFSTSGVDTVPGFTGETF